MFGPGFVQVLRDGQTFESGVPIGNVFHFGGEPPPLPAPTTAFPIKELPPFPAFAVGDAILIIAGTFAGHVGVVTGVDPGVFMGGRGSYRIFIIPNINITLGHASEGVQVTDATPPPLPVLTAKPPTEPAPTTEPDPITLIEEIINDPDPPPPEAIQKIIEEPAVTGTEDAAPTELFTGFTRENPPFVGQVVKIILGGFRGRIGVVAQVNVLDFQAAVVNKPVDADSAFSTIELFGNLEPFPLGEIVETPPIVEPEPEQVAEPAPAEEPIPEGEPIPFAIPGKSEKILEITHTVEAAPSSTLNISALINDPGTGRRRLFLTILVPIEGGLSPQPVVYTAPKVGFIHRFQVIMPNERVTFGVTILDDSGATIAAFEGFVSLPVNLPSVEELPPESPPEVPLPEGVAEAPKTGNIVLDPIIAAVWIVAKPFIDLFALVPQFFRQGFEQIIAVAPALTTKSVEAVRVETAQKSLNPNRFTTQEGRNAALKLKEGLGHSPQTIPELVETVLIEPTQNLINGMMAAGGVPQPLIREGIVCFYPSALPLLTYGYLRRRAPKISLRLGSWEKDGPGNYGLAFQPHLRDRRRPNGRGEEGPGSRDDGSL